MRLHVMLVATKQPTKRSSFYTFDLNQHTVNRYNCGYFWWVLAVCETAAYLTYVMLVATKQPTKRSSFYTFNLNQHTVNRYNCSYFGGCSQSVKPQHT